MALSRHRLIQIIRQLGSYGDQFQLQAKKGGVLSYQPKTIMMVGEDLCKYSEELLLLIEDAPIPIPEVIPERGESE